MWLTEADSFFSWFQSLCYGSALAPYSTIRVFTAAYKMATLYIPMSVLRGFPSQVSSPTLAVYIFL